MKTHLAKALASTLLILLPGFILSQTVQLFFKINNNGTIDFGLERMLKENNITDIDTLQKADQSTIYAKDTSGQVIWEIYFDRNRRDYTGFKAILSDSGTFVRNVTFSQNYDTNKCIKSFVWHHPQNNSEYIKCVFFANDSCQIEKFLLLKNGIKLDSANFTYYKNGKIKEFVDYTSNIGPYNVYKYTYYDSGQYEYVDRIGSDNIIISKSKYNREGTKIEKYRLGNDGEVLYEWKK